MNSSLSKLLLDALWASHDGLAELHGREIVLALEDRAICHLVDVQSIMELCLDRLRRLNSGETVASMRDDIRSTLTEAMGAFKTLEGALTRKPGGQPVVIDHSSNLSLCAGAIRALEVAANQGWAAAGS